MAFNREEVAILMGQCHRRCCICHQFCGVKMETDHIIPTGDDGNDEIENAIPVCFACHAEIHSYNNKHPRGRKFTPAELRQHKDQWLKICKENPEIFVKSFLRSDVGPLNALIDELEFNAIVAEEDERDHIGCNFQNEQFKRAVQVGAISIVKNELKEAINKVYAQMGSVNQYINAASKHTINSGPWAKEIDNAKKLTQNVKPLINKALEELYGFLCKEND